MGHRTFTDRNGLSWTVSEVSNGLPTLQDERVRRGEPRSIRKSRIAHRIATRPLDEPWLCFESSGGSRSLTPVPAGWDTVPDTELEDMLTGAAILNGN